MAKWMVATSDIHFIGPEVDDIRSEGKRNNLHLVRELSKTHKLDYMLTAGDVTENGTDNLWPPARPEILHLRWPPGKNPNEYGGYWKWRNEIKKHVGKFHECRGNHDTNVPKPYVWRPFDYYQIANDGGFIYCRDLFHKVKLMVLGQDPSRKHTLWAFKWQLNHFKDHKFIVMYHYNCEGPFSDWITHPDRFSEFLDDFKDQIILMIHGHHHSNDYGEYHGVKYLKVAGAGLALIKYTPEEGLKYWFVLDHNTLGDQDVWSVLDPTTGGMQGHLPQ